MAMDAEDQQQEIPIGSRTLTFPPDDDFAVEVSPEEEVEIERQSELLLVHSHEQLLELQSSSPSAYSAIPASASASHSSTVLSDTLPRHYNDAVKYPHWKESVQRELNSLEKCNIMEIIDVLPDGVKPLDWTYVFKVKTDLNTGVKTYKSRATLRGDRQIAGVDYDETFAPVVRLKTLRTLLALAAIYGWHVHGMDVDTAFLNGEIAAGEKPVFVKLPHGYPLSGKWTGKRRDKLYGRLLKHVYGLKQAPRTWNGTLHEYLLFLGFKPTDEDACLYIRIANDGTVAYAAVFVDDLVLVSASLSEVNLIKVELSRKWDMKDLGPLSSILGMKVIRNVAAGWLTLSQEKYALDVLERFGMSNCSPVSTPMDPGVVLSKSMSHRANLTLT
jgi:hypothetical protein